MSTPGNPANIGQASKDCLSAKMTVFRCEKPIDAANYIGVTFDILKGYGQGGFRGRLVKVEIVLLILFIYQLFTL